MKRLIGLAAVASIFGSSIASAAVVTSTVNLAIPDNGIGLYVNVIDGSTYSGPNTFPTNPGPGANYDFNFFGGTTSWSAFSPGSSGQSLPTVPATSKGYVAATTSGPILALPAGTVIGPASTFNTSSPSATAIATGTDVYVGFRFRNEGPDLSVATDDTVHYGWALINLPTATLTQPGTLIAYAYESTPNTAITVPLIPEPASLASFALVGAFFRRRR